MAITRELEEFGELMRRISLKQVPTAILSRQPSEWRKCLIVNLRDTSLGNRYLPERGLSRSSLLPRSDQCPTNRGKSRCTR